MPNYLVSIREDADIWWITDPSDFSSSLSTINDYKSDELLDLELAVKGFERIPGTEYRGIVGRSRISKLKRI